MENGEEFFDNCQWPAARLDRESPGRLDPETLDDPSVHQMLVDYFIDILSVDVAVPDIIRVHHQHRSFRTTIETPGRVNPNLAGTRDTKLFAAFLDIVAHGPCIEALTASRAVLAQIGTKKYVVALIRHMQTIPEAEKQQQPLSPAHEFLYL